MIFVWLGCYAILAASLIVPFRMSSAESRREEKELKGVRK